MFEEKMKDDIQIPLRNNAFFLNFIFLLQMH